MRTGRIAIIDNIGGEYGDHCFRREAMPFEGIFECLKVEAQKGLPDCVETWAGENSIRGMVIGGAFESPIDDDDWIRREEEFVRRFVALRIPVLAICFGHEVLGSALGCGLGEFEEPRVELDTIEIIKNDPIFSGFDGFLAVPVSHSVWLREIPDGFELLGRSEKCEICVMKHRDLPVYGVQFHPEVDNGVTEHDPDWRAVSNEDFKRSDGPKVLENFRNIVLARAGGEPDGN